MPAKTASSGIDIKAVEAALPGTFFVMRGHIKVAFGLSRRELDDLVERKVFVAKYPMGARSRARFLRSQVLAVARTWETVT